MKQLMIVFVEEDDTSTKYKYNGTAWACTHTSGEIASNCDGMHITRYGNFPPEVIRDLDEMVYFAEKVFGRMAAERRREKDKRRRYARQKAER